MKLKFFATYREITRCNEEDIPVPHDVWELLTSLGERYGAAIRVKLFTPDGGKISDDAIILVNGRNILHLKGKDTPLDEADAVSIFPMVAGG
ncbi:MAG: MoaD/ThiS family protein [Synergistaceae bacterium]|nr:MoaD/ThiS family protein [Synergistaceae bacterium]